MAIKIAKETIDALLNDGATPGEARIALYSTQNVKIKPLEMSKVKTGLQFNLPPDTLGLVWDKKGSFEEIKKIVLGGVFNSDHNQEIVVSILNTSDDIIQITKGEQVAELIIRNHLYAKNIYAVNSSARNQEISFNPEEILT